MRTLIYSFRTNRHKEFLQQSFEHVFIFENTLKEEFERLKTLILTKKPDWIIGIGMIKRKRAVFDYAAINKFHKNGSVTKNGKEEYPLFIPDDGAQSFKKAPFTTNSFCNWTAYKIAEFIEKNNLQIKSSFIHLHEDFLPDLQKNFIS